MRRAALLVLALSCAAPGLARAHGRPPVVTSLTFVPNAPQRIVGRGTWGLVVSDDDGASWSWICAAAYGVDATIEDPHVHANADGSIVVGSFGGLWRSRLDRCEWSTPDPDLINIYVIDVQALPGAPDTLLAIETNGSGPDRVHVSFDAGVTFEPLSAPVDDILLERVRVAPSDPMRVYLSGAQPVSATNMTRRGFFFRSVDGGQTLTPIEVPLIDEEKNVHVLAVDPSDPTRVLVRMTRRPVDARPERVLLTEDGGDTFTEVLAAQRISGAVFAEDGARVWISVERGENASDGPPTGLWRSEDAGRTYTQLSSRDLTCVARRGDEIWICANELREGMSLRRSDDGGDSFVDALQFDQIVELPSCDPCSKVGFICPAWFPDLAFDLMLDASVDGLDGGVSGAPRDAAPPAMCGDGSVIRDAGPPPPPPDPDCGCAFVPTETPDWPLALLALTLWLRRRRIDWRTKRSVH